jgi:cell division transport system permease protein
VTRVRAFVYGLARALRGARARPVTTLLSTGAIAVSLILVGVLALAHLNVDRLTAKWGRGVHMVVYLKDDVTPERARAIGRVLGQIPAIERVDYVPSDEAQRRLAESLGPRQDLLDGVEAGFLPASLEVTLTGGVRDVAAQSPVIERLKRTPGVDEVSFLGDWVDRLASLLGLLRTAALALALLVAGACVYIIGGTIKLGMYARRDELDILRLVGATDAFVRLPLVVEGALQGVCGAACALAALAGLYRLAAPTLERALASAVGDVKLTFLPGTLLLAALGVGLALGVMGSALAVGRHAEP